MASKILGKSAGRVGYAAMLVEAVTIGIAPTTTATSAHVRMAVGLIQRALERMNVPSVVAATPQGADVDLHVGYMAGRRDGLTWPTSPRTIVINFLTESMTTSEIELTCRLNGQLERAMIRDLSYSNPTSLVERFLRSLLTASGHAEAMGDAVTRAAENLITAIEFLASDRESLLKKLALTQEELDAAYVRINELLDVQHLLYRESYETKKKRSKVILSLLGSLAMNITGGIGGTAIYEQTFAAKAKAVHEAAYNLVVECGGDPVTVHVPSR